MATPLAVKQANKNKNVDDIFLSHICTRLTWQPGPQSWKIESKQHKLFSYYFVIYGLFGSAYVIPGCFLVPTNYLLSLEILSVMNIITLCVLSFFGGFLFFFDLVCIEFGQELTETVNYLSTKPNKAPKKRLANATFLKGEFFQVNLCTALQFKKINCFFIMF